MAFGVRGPPRALSRRANELLEAKGLSRFEQSISPWMNQLKALIDLWLPRLARAGGGPLF